MTLDGSKTGMTVRPEVLQSDTKAYGKRPPAWKETEEDRERKAQFPGNEVNLSRPPELRTFIMDVLHAHATTEGNRQISKIEIQCNSVRLTMDATLAAPWLAAVTLGERFATEGGSTRRREDLGKIKEHVKAVYAEHRKELGIIDTPRKRTPSKKKAAFTDLPIEMRQDKIRALSKKYASLPLPSDLLMSPEEIAMVKASCAYVFDWEEKGGKGWTRFPFDVAMRELCGIKARASGRFKVVSGDFYDDFNMKHPVRHHF